MATRTVSSGDYIRPYRRPVTREFLEAASQTFKIGDPLILQTSADKGHQVKIAGSDPTADRFIVGFAATAAAGVENTRINVWLATPTSEFVVCVQSGGAIDNDDISVQYGIVADGTYNIWRIDLTETSAKVFTILDLHPDDTALDVNGRYIVKVINSEALYG